MIVRVAFTKTLPTDEMLMEAGYADAGLFFLDMQASTKGTDALADFVYEYAHHWCATPPPRP